MLIEYTRPNVFSAPLTISKGAAVIKILRFTPGVNEINDKDWKHFLKDHKKKAEKHLETGVLVVIAETSGDDDKTALTDLTAVKAKLAVGKTLNPILLEEWKNAETRSGVLKAINAQLGMIDAKTNPNKEAVND